MNKLEKIEMGKLVGGANEITPSDGGTHSTGTTYSSDCVEHDEDGEFVGATYYSYSTDSARGWVNPCAK